MGLPPKLLLCILLYLTYLCMALRQSPVENNLLLHSFVYFLTNQQHRHGQKMCQYMTAVGECKWSSKCGPAEVWVRQVLLKTGTGGNTCSVDIFRSYRVQCYWRSGRRALCVELCDFLWLHRLLVHSLFTQLPHLKIRLSNIHGCYGNCSESSTVLHISVRDQGGCMYLLIRFSHKEGVCHHLGHRCVMLYSWSFLFVKNRSY